MCGPVRTFGFFFPIDNNREFESGASLSAGATLPFNDLAEMRDAIPFSRSMSSAALVRVRPMCRSSSFSRLCWIHEVDDLHDVAVIAEPDRLVGPLAENSTTNTFPS